MDSCLDQLSASLLNEKESREKGQLVVNQALAPETDMKSLIQQPRKHSPVELYQRNNQETPFNENHARTAMDLTDQTNATKRQPWKTSSRFFTVQENVLTALGQTTCRTDATRKADAYIVRRNTTPPSATPPRRRHLANPTHQLPRAAVLLPPHSRVIQES